MLRDEERQQLAEKAFVARKDLEGVLWALAEAGFAIAPVEATEAVISAIYQTIGEMGASETRDIDLLEDGAERIYRSIIAALKETSDNGKT